jgi:hypothetical protein
MRKNSNCNQRGKLMTMTNVDRKWLIGLSLILLTAALAFAVDSWATCPLDGAEANWTGHKKWASQNAKPDCEYSHNYGVDDQGNILKHTFWTKCDDDDR